MTDHDPIPEATEEWFKHALLRQPDPVVGEPPVLANSGALDVSVARPGGQGAAGVSGADRDSGTEGQIEHGQWKCIEESEDDSEGWSTPIWRAEHKLTGERRMICHSRFRFHMTEARFRWLVENDFPRPPGKAPWSDSEIDAAMEDGA